jgi:hypothetical protein
MSFSRVLLGSFLIFLFTGCATIVGDPTHNLSISSDPSQAEVRITDETGSEIYTGSTPTNVTLDKSDGSYWGGKTYQVEVSKSGYRSRTITIDSAANGWYLAGNFVFGGLIGWFIVDPLNGNMYNLRPEAVQATLQEGQASADQFSENELHIVLIEDVPEHLRAAMVRIN